MSPGDNAVDYSPTNPEVVEDPHSAYAELRARCPVHVGEAGGITLTTVAEPDLVREVLLDPGTWSNAQGPGLGTSNSRGDMQHDDEPLHGQRRRFARDWFLPRAVDELEPPIRELALSQADSMAAKSSADLYSDFALPLPVTSFCQIMGVELYNQDQFIDWADALTNAMAYPETGQQARVDINTFTRDEIQRRRDAVDRGETVEPGLLTHLAVGEWLDGERMPIDEATNMSNQLLIAGHETTTSLITNLMWRLLEVPERWQRLVAEPGLIENAVEESLRYDPPVLGLCRAATRDSDVGGVSVEAGAKIMMLYASANRDPERFENPDEFRLDRPLLEAKQHLSFSWGIHHCLGAHLARLTARVGIEVLVDRFPNMTMSGSTKRVLSPFLWGRKSLPVHPG